MDHVNHEIDLMGYLLGNSEFSAVRKADSPQKYRVTGKRLDGIEFAFSGSRSKEVRNWDESKELLLVVFKRGTLEVASHESLVRIVGRDRRKQEYQIPPRGTHFDCYADVMQNFADVACGKAEPYVSLKEMLVNTAAGVFLTSRGEYDTRASY